MTTTSLFPLASPHGEPSLVLCGLADRANHEGHCCACIGMRLCVCVCIQCACSFTVHRNELRLQVLILNTFFLYVYECTFVPKNLDRVRGH